jgi:hypothetical protein
VRHRYLLVLALAIAVAGSLIAGASATGPGGWDHLGTGTAGGASLNSAVSVLNADVPGTLLVGGNFTNAGGVADADGVASWNGLSWSAVGPGVTNGIVMAIAYKDGKVYIGGNFTDVGGDTGLDRLAVWDGVSWQAPCNGTPPAIGGNVTDLQIIGDTLWVGGEFQNGAGIASADYLLACDLNTGDASSPFLVDGDGTGPMYALAADGAGNLYGVGTFINLAGILQADYVAKYSGGAWQAMGSGLDPGVGAVDGITRSITTKGTDVFIGSDALDIGGFANADHVAKWNGSAWSALGSNTAGGNGWFTTTTSINALDAAGTELVAAGQFQDANGDPLADHVAAFDGSAWHPVGSDGAGNGPINGTGLALATFRSGIFMGGSFTSAGGDTQARFAASYGAVPVAVPTPTVTPPPPPAPTPTPTPAVDNTPPAVSAYKLSATVFRPLPSGGSIAAVKLGTIVRYRLSEAARVPFVVDMKSRGRKAGKKCVKPKPSNRRKKACVRYVKVGGFTHSGVAGGNQFRFSGRIKRKALKPGNYRLVAVAVDAAGNKSAQLSRPFRIVR